MNAALDVEALSLARNLLDVARRAEAASALAHWLGGDRMILFVADPELDVLLPARGFQQTLPDARRWRAFLQTCVAEGQHVERFPHGQPFHVAYGVASTDGSVLVVLDGEPDKRRVQAICALLPFITNALRNEQLASIATEKANAARTLAMEAKVLAESLDKARHNLQTALQEVQQSRRRLAFLADVSAILSSSLDLDTVLASLSRLLVPSMGDYCLIFTLDEDGRIEHSEVAHRDKLKEALLRELQCERGTSTPPEILAQTLHRGDPFLVSEADDRLLRELIADSGRWSYLHEHGPVTYLLVPLRLSDQALGIIALVTAESRRELGEDDVAMAREIAHRAAYAIENARLYRRLQESVRVRDEFLSVAAHELKTPITGLRGFAQLLLRQISRETPSQPDRWRRALEAIDQQSERLTRLVGQLLDISRLQSGVLRLDRTVVDLVRLTSELVERTQMTTGNHAIRLRSPSRLSAYVDPLRLEQVLSNLLDNAVKYSPRGGEIEVEIAERASGRVVIAIRDYGIGISEEDRERIFERFYRVQTDSNVSGLGLGLYITKQIVELHGGRIYIDLPPDRGTRFVIELPMIEDGKLPAAPSGQRE